MSFPFINVEAIGKSRNVIFFSNLKKCISPASEFLLHKCRNNKEIQNWKKKTKFGNNYRSSAKKFSSHKCRNNRKIQKGNFPSNLNKFTSPAYKFLLHKCKNNRQMQKCKKKLF